MSGAIDADEGAAIEPEATAPEADVASAPSKSRRKREAAAIHALGRRLAEMAPATRAALPLDAELHAALDALDGIRAHGARKRQLAYLAKRLRAVDRAPLESALARLDGAARASAARHHRAERWRERLLGAEPGLTPAAALTACLDAHPTLERQRLRQLQRRALAEREAARAPTAARALYRLLRDAIDPSADHPSAVDGEAPAATDDDPAATP